MTETHRGDDRGAIVFTDHARKRYQRRIPRRIPLDELAIAGRIQSWPPGCLTIGQIADAYLVHGEAVFPLLNRAGGHVAVTCLRLRRLSKAERRARRDNARDQDFDRYHFEEAA